MGLTPDIQIDSKPKCQTSANSFITELLNIIQQKDTILDFNLKLVQHNIWENHASSVLQKQNLKCHCCKL